MPRTLTTLLLVLATTLALAACANEAINAANSERFVRGVVVREIGVRVASVRCPQGLTAQNGTRFSCLVTGPDGSTGRVRVRQIDDNANIAVSAPFLHMRDVEQTMRGPLSRRLKAEATIACEEIVVVRKGELFRCTARYNGRSRAVSARMTDESGRFRYRLSPTAAG